MNEMKMKKILDPQVTGVYKTFRICLQITCQLNGPIIG